MLSFVNSQTSTSHGSRSAVLMTPRSPTTSVGSLLIVGVSVSLTSPTPHATWSNLNSTPSAVVSVIVVVPVGTMISPVIVVLLPAAMISCGVGSVPPF